MLHRSQFDKLVTYSWTHAQMMMQEHYGIREIWFPELEIPGLENSSEELEDYEEDPIEKFKLKSNIFMTEHFYRAIPDLN